MFQQAGFEPQIAMQVNDIFTPPQHGQLVVGHALLLKRIRGGLREPRAADPAQPRLRLQQHIGVVFLQGQGARPEPAGVARGVPDVQLAWSREAAG